MVVSGKTRLFEQFQEQGFLKVEGLLDPKTVLDPVIEEYKGVLDRYCETLYEDGRLSSKYEGLSFEDRFLKVCLLYTSPSPRDGLLSRMPSSA